MPFKTNIGIKVFYFLLVFFSLTFYLIKISYKKETLYVIDGDGIGYYAYLPAIIIQHDLSWKRLSEYCPEDRQTFLNSVNEGRLNKYPIGTSLLMLPFFLAAYFYSFLFQNKIDPNNFIFHFFVFSGAVFYFLAGLYFSIKSLLIIKIKENALMLSVCSMLFGTSILFYAFFECSLSHIYSFFTICGFGYFMCTYFNLPSRGKLFLGLLFLFFTILIRPFNILVIGLIPFLRLTVVGSNNGSFFNYKLIVGIVFSLIIAFTTLVLFNYLQCGTLILNSYINEGFNFTNPELINFLFSARKGLFFYSPILLVGILYSIFMAFSRKVNFRYYSIFFLFLFYLMSSWWNWFYGDSYGQRVFVDYYYFSLFPLAYFFEGFSQKVYLKISAFFILGVFSIINIVQLYQVTNGILLLDGMTWNKYKFIFLKTNNKYAGILGEESIPIYGTSGKPNLFYYLEDYQNSKSSIKNKIEVDPLAKGNFGMSISNNIEFAGLVEYKVPFLEKRYSRIYVSVDFDYLDSKGVDAKDIAISISVQDNANKSKFFNATMIMDYPSEELKWHKRKFTVELKTEICNGNKLTIFFYNPHKKSVLIDNYKIVVKGYS